MSVPAKDVLEAITLAIYCALGEGRTEMRASSYGDRSWQKHFSQYVNSLGPELKIKNITIVIQTDT